MANHSKVISADKRETSRGRQQGVSPKPGGTLELRVCVFFPGLFAQQRDESRLLEMLVMRKRLDNASLLHQIEGRTIRETPFLVHAILIQVECLAKLQ